MVAAMAQNIAVAARTPARTVTHSIISGTAIPPPSPNIVQPARLLLINFPCWRPAIARVGLPLANRPPLLNARLPRCASCDERHSETAKPYLNKSNTRVGRTTMKTILAAIIALSALAGVATSASAYSNYESHYTINWSTGQGS
jgi:hypothetical protein